ncbi:MAG: D-alanyl-D-alanine carboxypeptidase [Lentisphaerae bacterium]|nr:D-alanyl-D-alanine carboxypeptidase [Lentisphaerota bacterium]
MKNRVSFAIFPCFFPETCYIPCRLIYLQGVAMPWKKIVVLLLIISVVHLVVIYGCVVASKTDVPGNVNALERVFERLFSAGENEEQDFKSPEKKNSALRVSPWLYGKNPVLPGNLKKQAAKAKSVMIVDLTSRRVLYEQNSREKVAIASLTKLMTLLVVSDQMQSSDKLALDNVVKISDAAASVEYPGLKRGSYTVKDLLYSMILGSFNDAATQLAITACGDVAGFVAAMNQRALDMGLAQTEFLDPSGLPQGDKRANSCASAADVLHLCEAVTKNPQLRKICSTARYTLSMGSKRRNGGGTTIGSGNQMINGRDVPGAFGFKTGFTNAAGRCVAFGVERNGRIIIGCITGYPSAGNNALFSFAVNLTNWAFEQDR